MRPDTPELFGTIIVSTSLFYGVEEEELKEIITGPAIDMYDVTFIKCNTNPESYSVATTDTIYAINTLFEQSGGITSIQNPSSIRIHYHVSHEATSGCCLNMICAAVELCQNNMTHSKCIYVFNSGYGPKSFSSRFISVIENECSTGAKFEADYSGTDKNSHVQFVGNKCKDYLMSAYRAECLCNWFYFINNNVTNCMQDGSYKIVFTHCYSTSTMKITFGTTSGIIDVNPQHTEPPFPVIAMRNSQTKDVKRVNLTLSIAIAFINLCSM